MAAWAARAVLAEAGNENWRKGKCSLKYHPFWSGANNFGSEPKVKTPLCSIPLLSSFFFLLSSFFFLLLLPSLHFLIEKEGAETKTKKKASEGNSFLERNRKRIREHVFLSLNDFLQLQFCWHEWYHIGR